MSWSKNVFCYLHSLPLRIDLLDSPDLLETTANDVAGAPDTKDTPQAPGEVSTATRQAGLEGPEGERRSK